MLNEMLFFFRLFVFQADLQSTLGDAGYVVFGVILFVWELLPTSLVVFFFRVRQPNQDRVSQRLPSASSLRAGGRNPPRGHKMIYRKADENIYGSSATLNVSLGFFFL